MQSAKLALFRILSKANIQYGLTLSKALDKSASKTQAELSPSRILWIHETAFCGSLKYDITACEGCMRCAVWTHNICSDAAIN